MTITLPDAMRATLVTEGRGGGVRVRDEYVTDVLIADDMPDVVEPPGEPHFRTRARSWRN